MKRKLVAASIISASLTLTSCGNYQGFTRYPCQEYENWTKPECINECKATGTCTADVLPAEILEAPSEA